MYGEEVEPILRLPQNPLITVAGSVIAAGHSRLLQRDAPEVGARVGGVRARSVSFAFVQYLRYERE